MPISLGRSATVSRWRTCLVHNVDKGLRVILGKATGNIIHVLAYRDPLDQGGQLIWDKIAFDQTFED